MSEKDLLQKIEWLESRVELLEKQVFQTTAAKNINQAKSVSQEMAQPVTESQKDGALNSPSVEHPKTPAKKEIDWEQQLGQVWLPRVFIFVLLIGLIWGFKAAVDHGLLAPPMRVIIGYVFGLLLFVLGEWQVKHNRRILGIVLVGGSIVTMMITTFAMQVLYHMTPAIPAMGINLLWILAGFYLSFRHKTEALGVLVGIGGYLIPFLVHSNHPSIYGLAIFEFVLFMGYVLIAIQQKYRVLFHVSNYLLSLTYFASLVLSGGLSTNSGKVLASFILAQFALMTGLYFYKKLFKFQFIAMYSLAVLTSAWVAATFGKPMTLSILAMGCALYIGGFLWNTRQKDSMKEAQHVTLTIASYFLAIWFVRAFEQNNSALYLSVLIEGVLLTLLGLKLKSRLHEILGLILGAAASIGILTEHYTHFWSFKMLVLFAFSVACGVLYSQYNKEAIKEKVIISGIVFVASLIIFLTFSTQTVTTHMSIQVQNVSISCVWGVFAFLSVVYGQIMGNRKIRIFGIVTIFIVLVKMITNDIVGLSITVRALLFIALGIVGIIMSRLFYVRR